MVKNMLLVKRYAEAFLSAAKSSIGADRAVDELKSLKVILRSNRDFDEFLNNPEITYNEKSLTMDAALGKFFSEDTINLLKLLLEKGRIAYAADICDYIRTVYSHGEATEALLRTSYPVDTNIIKLVKKALEKKLHKKINLYLELDPDILGGLQIRIGNTLIDGSVKRRLSDLRAQLMAVKV